MMLALYIQTRSSQAFNRCMKEILTNESTNDVVNENYLIQWLLRVDQSMTQQWLRLTINNITN